MLRLVVLGGVDRTTRALSAGRETTIVAVHISAVHHASAMMLVMLGKEEW